MACTGAVLERNVYGRPDDARAIDDIDRYPDGSRRLDPDVHRNFDRDSLALHVYMPVHVSLETRLSRHGVDITDMVPVRAC